VAYDAAWVNGTSQTILNTKEIHRNSGVRVQVEFTGSQHDRKRQSNHPVRSPRPDKSKTELETNIPEQVVETEYELGKFTAV
jgi:hypothetical protein